MHTTLITCGLALVYLLLTGCSLGPDYVRPDSSAPSAWALPDSSRFHAGAWPERTWWKVFDLPELDALMDKALTDSLDLKAAVARIEQARTLERATAANRFPGITAGLSGGMEQKAGAKPAAATSLNATLNYEMDIWGKNKSMQEAASAGYLGSIQDMRGVVVTLTTDLATLYFKALALNDRCGIIKKAISDEERLLTITDRKYRLGDISGLEIAQAKQRLASLKAQLPIIEQQRNQAEYGLALLTGQNPGTVQITGSLATAAIPVSIPVGIPSGLLERRPDIRKAEMSLVSANADIGRAKAALFPTIRLTVQGGYAGEELLKLISPANALYAIGGDMVVSIFNRDTLNAEYDRTQARYQELLHNYRKSILFAFREVADALVAARKQEEQELLLETSVSLAERAYTLSETRYRQGLTDFTTVLTADRSLLDARTGRLQTRLDRINALIQLYSALGGGWS